MACLFGVVGNVPVEAAVQSASTQQGKASGQEQADTYVMEDTVVTATRSKKKDVDVPAATVVITKQQIKESGATNAAEALGKVNGITYKSFGPRGASMGTMNNEINIRGVDNGTLVLVNGNPIAWRGKYNMEEIPADTIERIEIVKGGGSVLYGSEAMSGVINIITKKGAENRVSAGFGNYGQRNYSVSAGDKNFGVHYSFDRWKNLDGISLTDVAAKKFSGGTRTDIKDIEKENIGLSYKINENLDVLYNYYKTKANYERYIAQVDKITSNIALGEQYNGRNYTTEQHIGQVNFHLKDWKASAYFNTGTVESAGPTYVSSTGAKTPTGWYNTREKNTTYGMDLQKSWQLGSKAKTILGFDLEHEIYQSLPAYSTTHAKDYMRNNWGVFGQWEQSFDAKNSGIFSARETWTTAALKNQNYSNFSMAGQWLHKMDKENNIYLSIGQSFIMPTFAEMYGASSLAVPNPDLKPQTGVNYEIGWKRNVSHHTWKAALFHTDIKDNISATWSDKISEYTYTNEDFRNTGIEISCSIAGSQGLSYTYGATWQNPEVKTTKKDYWDRKYGKLQLTGGVTYKKGKWTSALMGSYLCNRVQTPSSSHSYAAKPYFMTSWNTTYCPDAASEISLTIDNVLDRRDNYSHSSSNYYCAPINYMLSYTYKF